MPVEDAAQFLAGSPERRQLLVRLREDAGPPADLASDLPLSRRSVQRHLGQFVDRGWAVKESGQYRLTVTGELVVEEHTRYLDTLERIEAFSDFFAHLPDRDHAPEPRWLDDATLATATADNPQAPVHCYLDRIQTFETDHIRMVSPVLSRLFHEAHADLALDGVHTELVLSAATIERARELNPTEFTIVTSVDVLDLYRYPSPIEFGLTLGDDRIIIGAYDDDGQLRACVVSGNPELVGWGEERFERYRDGADPVEPPISLPFSFGNRT